MRPCAEDGIGRGHAAAVIRASHVLPAIPSNLTSLKAFGNEAVHRAAAAALPEWSRNFGRSYKFARENAVCGLVTFEAPIGQKCFT